VVNLIEWALNSDPSINSQVGLPTGTLQNNHLTLTFTRNSAATFVVEVSGDLTNWTAGSTYGPAGRIPVSAATTDVTPPRSPAGFTVVSDNTRKRPGNRRFIRL